MIPHKPDTWVILEIDNHGKFFHKVLAGWSGGYLQGDSWRMNSGITKIEFIDDFYYFYGETGSVYECHKDGETMRISQAGIYNSLKKTHGDVVRIVDVESIKPLYLKE